MRRKGIIAALAVSAATLAVAAYALAGGSGPGFNHLSATLQGYLDDRHGDVHGRRGK
jgi:hypothetical protein